MRRDRLTFAMIIGIPIIQLVLFGYAINTDPKQLPTAWSSPTTGPVARAIVAGMQISGYFASIDGQLLRGGRRATCSRAATLAFIVTIPRDFHARPRARRRCRRSLIEADATDPAASANARRRDRRRSSAARSRRRPTARSPRAAGAAAPVDVVVHRLYNPEGITAFNIVPGLLGVILTMTTTLMTALALTREVERGTMENLLAMPARPFEIMIGKIVPYIGFGFAAGRGHPRRRRSCSSPCRWRARCWLLLAAVLLFIAANVTLGYTFSTLARTQMQAMQMTFFFFLPSILLSGFMFPFRGMPGWAQVIGEVMPLTHFLRVVRGIMLKGNGADAIAPNLWPLALFLLAVATLALVRYRRTLD